MAKKPALDPKALPLEQKLERFGKELERLLTKYGLTMQLSAELVPASVDGTLGVRPTMRLVPTPEAPAPSPPSTPEDE